MESPPTSLFKYFQVNDYSLDSLRKGKLWLSHPKHFNDPYDCLFSLDFVEWRKSSEDWMRKAFDKNYSRPKDFMSYAPMKTWVTKVLEKEANELLANVGVCSLTSNQYNLLLWAHYANNHKGFCVEYRVNEESEFKKSLRKVVYENEYPQIRLKEFAVKNFHERNDWAFYMATVKANDWKYEDEWRLVTKHPGNYFFERQEIVCVFLGARCDKEDISRIQKAVKEYENGKNIPIVRVYLKNGRYKLDATPYEGKGTDDNIQGHLQYI